MRTKAIQLSFLDGQSVEFMPIEDGDDDIVLGLGVVGEDNSSTVLELTQETAEILLMMLGEYVEPTAEYPSQQFSVETSLE